MKPPNDDPPPRSYRYTYHVGFGDCDPAGIAYTGALVNAALRAIDRFLSDVTGGRGWYAMSVQLGMGMPFVHLDVNFAAPVRGDADLDFAVTITRLGRTSVGFQVTGRQGDKDCFRLDSVNVVVSRNAGKQSLPAWLRTALEPHLLR